MEGDVVEQPAPVAGHDQVDGLDVDVPAVGVLDELVARELEQRVPDAEEVRLRQRGRRDPLPVDEGAVGAAEVAHLPAERAALQDGVPSGDQHVVHHDVVAGGAPDGPVSGLQLVQPGEPGVGARVRPGTARRERQRPRPSTGHGRRGQAHRDAVVGVPQHQGRRTGDQKLGHPTAARERAVAAVVPELPPRGGRGHRRVQPGDPRVRDDDVGAGVPADGGRLPRAQHPPVIAEAHLERRRPLDLRRSLAHPHSRCVLERCTTTGLAWWVGQ